MGEKILKETWQHHFLKCFVFAFTTLFFKNLKGLSKSEFEPVNVASNLNSLASILPTCSPLPTLVQHGEHCRITLLHI